MNGQHTYGPVSSTTPAVKDGIPVFLISFNRGAMLEWVISGYRRLDCRTNIIIHDNGSTDPETLTILKKLESCGVVVAWCNKIHSAGQLSNVNETIKAYFRSHPPTNYVVSDCDVDISVAKPEVLSLYTELLCKFPEIRCVGPMLRIRDVPPTYPLYNRMMNRHIEQFWGKRPQWAETSFGRIAYLNAAIDTTFALHRAGEPFYRLKKGIRVYEPYEAKHLDWYVEKENDYTLTSDSTISHWNNRSEIFLHKNVKLEYSSYYAVRQINNELEEYIEYIHLGQAL